MPAPRECTPQHTQLQPCLSCFVTALPCWNHLMIANFSPLGHLLYWDGEAIRIFACNTIRGPWHLNTDNSWGSSLGGWPCWTQVGMVRTCTTPMLYWVSVGKWEETVMGLSVRPHMQGAVKTPGHQVGFFRTGSGKGACWHALCSRWCALESIWPSGEFLLSSRWCDGKNNN